MRWGLALIFCALCAVALAATKYDRRAWHVWADADHDCQDTRQEVLLRDALDPPTLDHSGCRVASGLWRDVYDGSLLKDPTTIDIDHLVPLKEAYRSGASHWSKRQMEVYANDLTPGHLVVTSQSLNRAKGDKDPADWRPPDHSRWCWYAETWLAIKDRWGLSLDAREARAVSRMLRGCPPSARREGKHAMA